MTHEKFPKISLDLQKKDSTLNNLNLLPKQPVQSEETFTGSTQVEARRGSMSELRHQLRPGFCDSHWHKSVNSPTGASGETVQDSSAVGV